MPTAAETTCPDCGAPVTAGASEGLCPGCLLGGVLLRGDMAGQAPVQEDPATLRRCGEYEILGLLARGGMGVVLRARQAGLSREVALKMIATADLAAPDEVRRFRLEAELIARLDHPHIVPVHTVGEHDGRPFFVMKLADGGTLAQRLERQTDLIDPREAAALMIKVARAVHFAHERGVLHRDLKPANILLDGKGEPLVSDFGLARLAQNPAGSHPSAGGAGTPAYMPPEQARGTDAVTTASDVYGLGAVFYHLLTGHPPFTGATALEVLRNAETKEPVHPRALNHKLDRDLATICLKCLEKSPARRYRSAAAFADDLDRWQRGEPVHARAAAWYERLWKWSKRHPATAALLAAGLLGTAVLGAVLAAGNVLLRDERNNAREQESLAKAGTARAEASEQAMRLNVYASDIYLARRALDDGNLGVARRTLARHVPAEGQGDLRGYEWFALDHLCRGSDLMTLSGHASAVACAAWSPDGRFLATGGRDNLVRILRAEDGAEQARLPSVMQQSKIADLALLASLPRRSPETTALLAPGGGVSIEEVRMRSRPSNLGETTSLSWSSDGAWFLTSGEGTYVRIWSASDWSLQGFIPVMNCVQAAFTPDSRQVVLALTGSASQRTRGEVRVYDAATLRRSLTIPDTVACFALARQTGLLVTTRAGGTIQFHDPAAGHLISSVEMSEDAFALALSPDGKRFAALHRSSGTLRSVETGAVISGIEPQGERLRCLAFSPDGLLLATGCSGHTLQLFDGLQGTPLAALRGHDDEVLALTFSPDGSRILTASNDQTARIWPAQRTSGTSSSIAETGSLAAASADGSHLLARAPEGTVRCLDAAGRLIGFTPPGPPRIALGFAPGSASFATLDPQSGTVEWWLPDGKSGGASFTIPVPGGSPFTASPEGGWIAVAPAKSAVRLYDWHTGRLLREIPKPPGRTSRLEASPGGAFLLAAEWPRNAALFDMKAQRWLERRRLTSGTLGPVAFTRDSMLMASGGDDNLVTIRETLTGKVLASLRGHMAEIKALAFTADDRTLASSSADATIRLWHTPTWRELGPLHRGPLCTALRFIPRGLLAEEFQNQWILMEGAAEKSGD